MRETVVTAWPLKLWRTLFAYLPLALYVALLFKLGTGKPGGPPGLNDKLLHFLGFMPLQIVAYRAIDFWRTGTCWSRTDPARTNLAAVGLTSAVGAGLEVWQYFLPHRGFELLDWVADTAGALVVAALIALMWRLRAPSRPDA